MTTAAQTIDLYHLLGKRPSSRHNCQQNEKSQVLLDRIPFRCADCMAVAAVLWCQANCWIRTVSPRFFGGFAREHDQVVTQFAGKNMRVIRARSCHIALQFGRIGHPERSSVP